MKEPIMTYALWTVQGLLALIFLFIGGKKLVLLPEAMTEQMPLALPALVPLVVGPPLGLGCLRPSAADTPS